MAKTVTAEADTSQKNEARRQRKKQARREAKIMLKIERAKKDVQKAQKKLTQAQSNLDADQTHLDDLEAKLQQLRTAQKSQAQEAPVAQEPQGSQAGEQLQAPELKPEDFQTQEAINEAYQEPLLMPASTPPQADTEAIEAFHTASIAPVEGGDDSASEEEQTLTPAASDALSYPSDEQSPSPAAITETDTTIPEDTSTRDSIFAPWQDETQSLIDHTNKEPELSNNPIASSPEKDETPTEATVGASNENEEENPQV